MSNTFTLRPASYVEIMHVANNLRPLDHEEFVAYTGRSPEHVMADAVFPGGAARCGFVNGEPAAIYGVDVTPEAALPWMVGTPALEGLAFGRFLLRTGRELFAGWAAEHGTLTNYAYAKNTLHIKFIRLLGCEVGAPQPHGALRLPFRKFTYVPSSNSSNTSRSQNGGRR